MLYKYETEKKSYEDLASGRVLYNAPGFSAFPVRLASEIAMRCFAILERHRVKAPYTIFDPCCGGAYLLATLGFLYGKHLRTIIAADIDPNAVALAKKNLSLLHSGGLQRRIRELEMLAQQHAKSSHEGALFSASQLLKLIESKNHELEIDCFESDATKNPSRQFFADLIMTDFPYGNLTKWRSEKQKAMLQFFAQTSTHMEANKSVLVVIADKSDKLPAGELRRIEHFKVGKRQISFFVRPH